MNRFIYRNSISNFDYNMSVKHATPVVLGIEGFRKLRYGICKDTLRYLLQCDPQKGGTELNESK